MGLPKLKTKVSGEDYLAGEKISLVRREYAGGEVFAMAWTSDVHNRIAINFTTALDNHLRDSPREPFSGDFKVKAAQNVFYYPDILVSCEENPASPYFRNNPILIVEITSPSTEKIDRREKLLFYLHMPSVQEYVIVSQRKMAVEVHRRQPDGRWITYYFNQPDEILELALIDLALPLTEIYRRVKFESNARTIDY